MNLEYYSACFEHLNCAKHKGKEAPHKPVLLLALIQLFEQGRLKNGEIYPNQALEDTFRRCWAEHVTDSDFKMLLGTPFYHMSNEKFWSLSIDEDCGILPDEKNKLKNINTLRRVNAKALLDDGLAACLLDAEMRGALKTLLLSRYFYRHEYQTDKTADKTEKVLRFKTTSETEQVSCANEQNLKHKSAA